MERTHERILEAMRKNLGEGLPKEALLETLKIARQAQANAVLGHATPLLEVL